MTTVKSQLDNYTRTGCARRSVTAPAHCWTVSGQRNGFDKSTDDRRRRFRMRSDLNSGLNGYANCRLPIMTLGVRMHWLHLPF